MPNSNLTKALDAAYDSYKSTQDQDSLFQAVYAYAEALLKAERGNSKDSEGSKEDLLQEATIRVWQKLSKFDGKSKFSTWTYAVIKNVEIDEFNEAMDERVEGPVNMEDIGDLVATEPNPETVYRVREAIENLPAKERALVQQVYTGDTVEEASIELGISRRTAFRRWKKAQAILRGDLK